MVTDKRDRLAPPLMHIFRDAHDKHDARKSLDLRDEDGERVIAGRRASLRRPVREAVLRAEVARNLADLLNTCSLGSSEDLTDLDYVERSILNYGIEDLAATTLESNDVGEIGEDMRRAIIVFEPRIVPETVTIVQDETVDEEELLVRFNVEAELRANPLNIAVEFVAEIETDNAKIRIERL